ncbi:MAG: phospholipase D-like domain-containing protein [Bacteroidota bacterium]|nr:phospholipase D-like domain-containing protein [Bacteroidota bacterium]
MYKTYFSPGEDCRNAIISKLKQAKKEVKICVFTITDNQIGNVLRDMHFNGINVKIISDNLKKDDRGSDIYYLKERGLNIRIDETAAHMHHKFAIIDDTILINGSYNWTVSAAEKNQENIIVTDNRDFVEAFSKEFDRLWDKFIPVKSK